MPQMSFRTITARYKGICRRCDGPIAVGDRIRYGGYGRTYHLKAECSAADDQDTPQPAPQPTPARYIATPAGPVSDRSWGTAADYGSRSEPPADDNGRDNGAPFVDDRDTGDRTADDEQPQHIPTPAQDEPPADDWSF